MYNNTPNFIELKLLKFRISNIVRDCFALLAMTLCIVVFGASAASAHVVVSPSQIGVGQRSNFTISVPTEESTPTVAVRLVIPDGVKSVRPNVKPGWNIEIKKSGEGESAKITEVIWTGGRIPAEQRDEFTFSAQAPASEGSIDWKAYQTYGDGMVVAWENSPQVVADYAKNNPPKEGVHDESAPKPFSVTKVVNDLSNDNIEDQKVVEGEDQGNTPLFFSLIALALSSVSIGLVLRKRA